MKKRNLVLLLIFSLLVANSFAAELKIGTATVDISPKLPIPLQGQFYVRIAKSADTPLSASIIALESVENGIAKDTAVMVSCDLTIIPTELLNYVRDSVHVYLPDMNVKKIFLNAIHTHTAPVIVNKQKDNGIYPLSAKQLEDVNNYRRKVVSNITKGIVKAWKTRSAGSVTWGLGHAVVAANRRATYSNGRAKMYGKTYLPSFRGIEGYEDHDVDMLFFWKNNKLTAIVIDVACPAQEAEGLRTVNADYWYPVREKLKKRFGSDLCVLALIGAAGDQSPHIMYRKAAEERMRKLRNISRLDELARRIVNTVNDVYDVVKDEKQSDVKFIHKVKNLKLPLRIITEAEYEDAIKNYKEYKAKIDKDPSTIDRNFGRMKWYHAVIERYEAQKNAPNHVLDSEVHAIRIGDVAICTNTFELFTTYGVQIKARSKALQTFNVQLTGPNLYLPTEKAVRGGHYSAWIYSCLVAPEGGHMLVDETVDLINSMWDDKESNSPNL